MAAEAWKEALKNAEPPSINPTADPRKAIPTEGEVPVSFGVKRRERWHIVTIPAFQQPVLGEPVAVGSKGEVKEQKGNPIEQVD